jgi:hypothetical protein
MMRFLLPAAVIITLMIGSAQAQGSTDQLVAAGSCRFSNPYKGKPARVSCTAETNRGKFAGEFISNSVAPNTSQSR